MVEPVIGLRPLAGTQDIFPNSQFDFEGGTPNVDCDKNFRPAPRRPHSKNLTLYTWRGSLTNWRLKNAHAIIPVTVRPLSPSALVLNNPLDPPGTSRAQQAVAGSLRVQRAAVQDQDLISYRRYGRPQTQGAPNMREYKKWQDSPKS